MSTLNIVNLTGSPISYASGVVTVLANSTVSVSQVNQYLIATDGGLRNDCLTNVANLTDGTITYGSHDAVELLERIAKLTSTTRGATDGTVVGNIGDKLKTSSTLYDSSGTELGTASNPITTSVALSGVPDLLNGRLFCSSVEVNAATSGTDNPLVLLRNPLGSGKNIFIHKIVAGISTVNVAAVFKVFAQPTLTSTTTVISTITQGILSATVTVTTATSNGATLGAQVTVSGTTNFNGTFTVASVISPTVYTFTTTVSVLGATEHAGTSVVASSLGTAMSVFPMKRVATPASGLALVTNLPTVPSNGSQLIAVAQGQNTIPPLLVDSAQISLEPGQNLLVTGDPNSNSRSTAVTLIWSEVPQ